LIHFSQRRFFYFAVVFVFLVSLAEAQDTTKSLAFKKQNRFAPPILIFKYYDPAYQLYDNFMLIKNANAGDAYAQHEIGLRYLTGEGFEPDTSLSFQWIKKAADQKFVLAEYNLGIFYFNGWGTEWNPFEAFTYFLRAAKQGMEQAQYNVGLIFTENLVIQRNLNAAYYWIKKSLQSGFEPAKETIAELEKRGITTSDSISALNGFTAKVETEKINSALLFIDFTTDTITAVSDSVIIEDMNRESLIEVKNNSSSEIKRKDLFAFLPVIDKIKEQAEFGNPESLVLLGKMFEQGIGVKKDVIVASEYYLRAIRLESPRAPRLLWDLIKTKNYFSLLREAINKGNLSAKFVWSGLYIIGFDYQITNNDVVKFLLESTDNNYTVAMTELGLCYFFGNILQTDKYRAIRLWEKAMQLGNVEAEIRLMMSKISEGTNNIDINRLKIFVEKNSILAQTTLAYCYEMGIGVEKNIPKAIELYRRSAYRGSRYAYNSLRRVYDKFRPDKIEFIIN